jgi:hypothetical protein
LKLQVQFCQLPGGTLMYARFSKGFPISYGSDLKHDHHGQVLSLFGGNIQNLLSNYNPFDLFISVFHI